jgi:hypothetical protein
VRERIDSMRRAARVDGADGVDEGRRTSKSKSKLDMRSRAHVTRRNAGNLSPYSPRILSTTPIILQNAMQHSMVRAFDPGSHSLSVHTPR